MNADTKFPDLKALYLNCTLKKSPRESHTDGLIALSQTIMHEHGVSTELIRPVDWEIPPGVQPDMTEKGYEKDQWPELFKKVMEADILVVTSPIWLGEKSSECTKLIERLYSNSSQQNDKGQYIYYGKAGGCLITGNEDGAKHCSMNILYSLAHMGFSIPPQPDAAWLGEYGPGPSYRDDNSGGPENNSTNRNVTFMTYNLLYLARMLKDNQGYPAYGNSAKAWQKGERFGFPSLHLE